MDKRMPKYKEIEQDIREQIHSGQLRSGDRIMTEGELCAHYGVSRMTARKALDALAHEGIVRRTAGKGTFVGSIHVKKTNAAITSFSTDIQSVGMKPGSKLIEYRVCRAKDLPDISSALNLEPDDLVHCIFRIRTANEVNVALSSTYIPYSILPALDIRTLEGSLYDLIQKDHEISSTGCCKTISAVIASPEQRRLLDIENEALLKISHATYLADGRPFEYSVTYYIGSRIIYTNSNPHVDQTYQMQLAEDFTD